MILIEVFLNFWFFFFLIFFLAVVCQIPENSEEICMSEQRYFFLFERRVTESENTIKFIVPETHF